MSMRSYFLHCPKEIRKPSVCALLPDGSINLDSEENDIQKEFTMMDMKERMFVKLELNS